MLIDDESIAGNVSINAEDEDAGKIWLTITWYTDVLEEMCNAIV